MEASLLDTRIITVSSCLQQLSGKIGRHELQLTNYLIIIRKTTQEKFRVHNIIPYEVGSFNLRNTSIFICNRQKTRQSVQGIDIPFVQFLKHSFPLHISLSKLLLSQQIGVSCT